MTGELLPEALETVLEAKPGLARVFLPGSPECVFAAETLALCRLKLLDEDSGTLADSWADAVAPGTRSRVTPDAEGLSVRRCAAETVFLAGRAASKTLRAISEFAEESGGPLCPLALRSRRCLAEALAILGDRGEAVKVYDELYVTLLFLKGPSSPDAMAVMADGAAAELESLFAEKGPCDLLTLEAALRLAESLVLLDREESRHLAQQVLETLETSGSRSGDMAARAKELASISRLS